MPYKDLEKRRAYKRAWRKKYPGREKRGPEQHPERYKIYRDSHKEEMSVKAKGRYAKDPERWKKYRREWVAAHPDKVKDYHYRSQYGISFEEKQARIARQGFICAGCGTSDPGKRGWQTDHDHETNQLRGELCGNCNRALGLLGDNPDKVEKLLQYLRTHKMGQQKC